MNKGMEMVFVYRLDKVKFVRMQLVIVCKFFFRYIKEIIQQFIVIIGMVMVMGKELFWVLKLVDMFFLNLCLVYGVLVEQFELFCVVILFCVFIDKYFCYLVFSSVLMRQRNEQLFSSVRGWLIMVIILQVRKDKVVKFN